MKAKETRMIIAGFGGQGIVAAGKILATACIYEGKNVTAMISYGAEMRGGTANCVLVIGDQEIASPMVEKVDVAIIMNQPSLSKFGKDVVKGGLLLLNTSLLEDISPRTDVEVVGIKATDAAQNLGNVKAANIVALGAFVKKTGLLKMESLAKAIENVFGGKAGKLVPLNIKAMEAGAALVAGG
jgi:2-oxoglutarate ferredoxin oxidoreductase subunit gamma